MNKIKRILITGANKGIGFATVEKLLKTYDETFILFGARDLRKGKEAINSLILKQREWRDRLYLIEIDVEKDYSVKNAAEKVSQKFSEASQPLYAILNNAGIGSAQKSFNKILQVNTYGPKRVCDAFIPLLNSAKGRVVNVTSASGPIYLATCSKKVKEILTNRDVTWTQIENFLLDYLKSNLESEQISTKAFPTNLAYGISKACTNAYTIFLAREYPNLIINACTPGFIETDLTRPIAAANKKNLSELGMKSPEEGTSANIFLLMDNPGCSGQYFGSDCLRSPFDEYRAPGDPQYTGQN